MRRIAALVGGLTLTVAACEIFTHSGDYEVDAGAPYQGFCNACPPSSEDLRHVPCPGGGDGDDGKTYVYAARYLYFGKPSQWQGANASSFELGYDLDCSNRPNGKPVLCKETTPDGGPMIPWTGLPHGIDNALSQRILGPLYTLAGQAGKKFDLDALVSQPDQQGKNGLLVTVTGWNGTPNDASVVMNIYSSPGVEKGNGPPKWDGTDKWDRYVEAPGSNRFFRIENADAYVIDGTLVADYRSRGDVNYIFGTEAGAFELLLHQVAFAGKITPGRLENMTMVARADVASAYQSIPTAARVLSGCNPAAESYLAVVLPELLVGAADMPSDPNASPDQACDSVSFGWAWDAEAAELGGYGTADSADAGCQ